MEQELIVVINIITGLFFLGSFAIAIKKRKNLQLNDTNLLIIILLFLGVNIFASFGNAIEWIQSSSELDEIGDYILTIIPLLWGGVFYALMEYRNKQKLVTAYNFSEFYKDILAHDMGNILQSILFMIELAELEPTNNIVLLDELALMKDEISKGEKLIKFARNLSPDEYSSESDVKLVVSTIFENVETRMKKKFSHQKIFVNISTESDNGTKQISLESFTEILFVALFTNLINFLKKTIIKKEDLLLVDISVNNSLDKIEINFPLVVYQDYLNENGENELFSPKRNSLETGISFTILKMLFNSIGYRVSLEDNKNSESGLIIVLRGN